nr:heat shock factor 1 [Halisarca dujardinii]
MASFFQDVGDELEIPDLDVKPFRNSQGTSSNQALSGFIPKLWNLVDQPSYQSLISWTKDGRSFVVHNDHEFAHQVLPRYFKTTNFNSFVRQLNLYGFRKVSKIDRGSIMTAGSVEPLEFFHTNFRRGHSELIHLIQRKTTNVKATEEHSVKSDELNSVLKNIHTMRDRQDSISTVIGRLSSENEDLRQEVEELKHRHYKQHVILNKLIQFVASIICSSRLPAGKKRSRPLMITAGEEQSPPDYPNPNYTPYGPPSKQPKVSPPKDLFQPGELSSPETVRDSLQLLLNTSSSLYPPTDGQSSLPLVKEPLSVPEPSTPEIDTALLPSFASLCPPPNYSPLSPTLDAPSAKLSEHLDSQQSGLDQLQGNFSDMFSLNADAFSEFMSSIDLPLPSYDSSDTNRLLETLNNSDHVDLSMDRASFPMLEPPSVVPPTEGSSLERLLESKPTSSQEKQQIPALQSNHL